MRDSACHAILVGLHGGLRPERHAPPALGRALALVLVTGCGAAPAASTVVAPCPACPPTVSEASALVEAATAALAAGQRADAAALVRALGSIDLDHAVAVGLGPLAAEPLPIVAPLAGRPFLRSDDRRFAVRRPLETRSEGVRPECPEIVLRRFDLEGGGLAEVRVPHGAERERLAALAALDGDGVSAMATVLAGPWPTGPTVEPSELVRYEHLDAIGTFTSSSESCGLLEQVSPRGRYAVATSLSATTERPCTGTARAVHAASAGHVCLVATAYLVDFETGTSRALGPARAVRFSPDDAWMAVRHDDGRWSVERSDGSAPPVDLGADGEQLAFSPRATALAVSREGYVDIHDLEHLDAAPVVVELSGPPFDDELSGTPIAIGLDEHGARAVLLFGTLFGARFAITDAAGEVTHWVGAAPSSGGVSGSRAAETTRHAPREGPRWARPHMHVSDDGLEDRLWRGERLERRPRMHAFFDGHALWIADSSRYNAHEIWHYGASEGRDRATWVRAEELEPPPEGAPIPMGDGSSSWRFTNGVYASTGTRVSAFPGDHRAGPSEWREPPADEDDDSADEAREPDAAALSVEMGTRTNLRVCRGDLRVVPVVPMPEPASVWAPEAACAPDAEPPEVDELPPMTLLSYPA